MKKLLVMCLCVVCFSNPVSAQWNKMDSDIKEFDICYWRDNYGTSILGTLGLSGDKIDTIWYDTRANSKVTRFFYSAFDGQFLVLGSVVEYDIIFYSAYEWKNNRWSPKITTLLTFSQKPNDNVIFIKNNVVEIKSPFGIKEYFLFDLEKGKYEKRDRY